MLARPGVCAVVTAEIAADGGRACRWRSEEMESWRRGKAILQPIVVCWRIVVVKAPQKCVGERHRSGGMCVGCEALEGGGVPGTKRVVRRGHVCVWLPSSAQAFFRFFKRGS
jgi:hypothetical protein